MFFLAEKSSYKIAQESSLQTATMLFLWRLNGLPNSIATICFNVTGYHKILGSQRVYTGAQGLTFILWTCMDQHGICVSQGSLLRCSVLVVPSPIACAQSRTPVPVRRHRPPSCGHTQSRRHILRTPEVFLCEPGTLRPHFEQQGPIRSTASSRNGGSSARSTCLMPATALVPIVATPLLLAPPAPVLVVHPS